MTLDLAIEEALARRGIRIGAPYRADFTQDETHMTVRVVELAPHVQHLRAWGVYRIPRHELLALMEA